MVSGEEASWDPKAAVMSGDLDEAARWDLVEGTNREPKAEQVSRGDGRIGFR